MLHELVAGKTGGEIDLDSVKAVLEKNKTSDIPVLLSKCEDNVSTVLGSALAADVNRTGVGSKKATLQLLLKHGGASSVFVKGYSKDSLVCTLPYTVQPPSSVLTYPKPLKIQPVDKEFIEMVDSSLVEEINRLVVAKSAPKPTTPTTINSAGAAAVAPAVAAPATEFDFFPYVLKVGATVRRGPDWRYGSVDGNPPGLGTISSVTQDRTLSQSGFQITVQWNSGGTNNYNNRYNNMYGGFGGQPQPANQTFQYDPTIPLFDLQLVNTANSAATPSFLSAQAFETSRKHHTPLQRGDKIRLRPGLTGSSYLKYSDHFKSSSKACLGRSSDDRIGLLVDLGKSDAGVTSEHAPITVANLLNGVLCQYSQTDLCYADGSSVGFVSPSIANVPAVKSVIGLGDRVQLSSTASPFCATKCLGQARLRLTGTVVNAGRPGQCSVVCSDPRSPAPNKVHLFSVSDLRKAVPNRLLTIGDRVVLDDSFFESSEFKRGDGWCLGTKDAKAVGIVKFAPPPDGNTMIQRNVLVSRVPSASEANVLNGAAGNIFESASSAHDGATYAFKSSWLCRAEAFDSTTVKSSANANQSQFFRPGDRVQLNPGCNNSSVEVAGKCLGSSDKSGYGIVLDVGPVRDGIQRNIQVLRISYGAASVSNSNSSSSTSVSRLAKISLYPSHVLVHAVRSAVLMDGNDTQSLVDAVSNFLRQNQISGIDIAPLVKRYGQEIWAKSVWALFTKKEMVVNAWAAWDQSRPQGWDTDLEGSILAQAQSEYGICIAKSAAGFSTSNKTRTWQCAGCKFNKCESGNLTCPVCKAVGGKWACAGCTSADNCPWELSCGACGKSHADSMDKIAALKAQQELNRLEEEERLRLEEEARNRPPERFAHVGSWDGCGGNPTGFARCGENGLCGTGCVRCGSGTHWSCCGSCDQASTECVVGITAEQAQRNAIIFATQSAAVQRCLEIPDTFFPASVDVVDWVCAACTFVNIITNKKCELCDTAAPTAVTKRNPIPPETNSNSNQQRPGGFGFGNNNKRKFGQATAQYAAGQRVTLSPSYRSFSDASSGILKPGEVGIICAVPDYNAQYPNVNSFIGSGAPSSHFLVCSEGDYSAYKSGTSNARRAKAMNVNLWYYERDALSLLGVVSGAGLGGVSDPISSEDIRSSELPPSLSSLGQAVQSSRTIDLTLADVIPSDTVQEIPDEPAPIACSYSDSDDDGTLGSAQQFIDNNDTDVPGPKTVDDDDNMDVAMIVDAQPLADNAEREFNGRIDKQFGRSIVADVGPPLEPVSIVDMDVEALKPSSPTEMFRAQSIEYHSRQEFEPITVIDDLILFKDKNGNTAAHHCAAVGLLKSYGALVSAGASRFILNSKFISPAAIFDGVATLFEMTPQTTSNGLAVLPLSKMNANNSKLYKQLTRHNIVVPSVKLALLACPSEYEWSTAVFDLEEALQTMDRNASMELGEEAVTNNIPHAHVYYCQALLDAGFGAKAVEKQLENYYKLVETEHRLPTFPSVPVDPFILFVLYQLHKPDAATSKTAKLRAAAALAAFRCFPLLAAKWLSPEDDLDVKVIEEGLEKDNEDEDTDDFDDEIAPPMSEGDPEYQWKVAKDNHKMSSAAMDKLMALTGLREVKIRAISVCKEVLLAKKSPANIKTNISMNFLFLGNAGTGKTTVASLLAEMMVELKFRKNPKPILTSANDILGAQDPVAAFGKMIADAKDGTLFIDEAYNFQPAPRGSTANASNKVLDMLMKVCEMDEYRETTTFILAGYKDDLLPVLSYNQGFASRFPITFEFPDYTVGQLQKIFINMLKERGLCVSPKRVCGVNIPLILARRIGRGANKKGFGNAREVRNRIEVCIKLQRDRLGTLELYGKPILPKDFQTLTRSDTIGDRPTLENSPVLKELDAMIGLASVKAAVRGLMNLQIQNYEGELREEKVKLISLHRVFFGNPGTGKTTVARLYGRLLKEFGFLSDGDLIEVKPSDLKGQAVGEASSRTAQILESAKGKVLFIDEAYGLDPARRGGPGGGAALNSYGGDVLDTLVEKIEGSAGSDMCVIMAGYEHRMRDMFRNAGNEGLKRRFNLDEALKFEDFTDDELKTILLSMIRNEGLRANVKTVNLAIKLVAQRRRLDDFGNAGEVSQILDRAKVKLSIRRQLHSQAMAAKSNGSTSASLGRGGRGGRVAEANSDSPSLDLPTPPAEFDMYELIESDFIAEETSAEKAREALSDLENVDHIMKLLNELEDTLTVAKQEGKDVAEILNSAHMVFTGPPGTGKTTVAQRFGVMFKNLELLPRSDVEVVTANNLISRYVGNTGPNVVEAMRKAKGGILFIDEAYAMIPQKHSFAGDCIQALVDNITLPEFQGNIIIILAGYKDQMERLFAECGNPGFRSRFEKVHVEFPKWTAEMATRATLKKIERDGLSVSAQAREVIPTMYQQLSNLPDWGSARDVYRNVLPAMYSKRANRLGSEARKQRILEEEGIKTGKGPVVAADEAAGVNRRTKAVRKAVAPTLAGYEESDVREAFASIINARSQGMIDVRDPNNNSSRAGAGQAGVQPVNAAQAFYSLLELTANERVLLVVDFFASWCGPCGVFKPKFEALSREFPGVKFITVDHDRAGGVFEQEGVNSMPTIKIYLGGAAVFSMQGGDDVQLRTQIMIFSAMLGQNPLQGANSKASSSKDRGWSPPTITEEPEELSAPKKIVKVTQNVESLVRNPGDEDGNDDDGPDEKSFWEALEQACGELRYTLDQMEEFLTTKEFPDALLELIKAKTGCNDISKVRAMLLPQAPAVLQKVKTAKQEIARKKSAEETARLEKARALGLCPMNYEWIKCPGGYRCAGGSHWVSEKDVNTIEI